MLLTDDEISDIYEQPSKTPREFARAVIAAYEAKLREQNESSHVLWETGEAGVPSAILDRNGEVVLGLCKICGKGECELVDPCKHPAPIPEGWISVDDRLPEVGRTPILVAVSWVKYGEHEDGTPTEATGVDVTEGEYVPAHGEAGGYFDSYQGSHGDSQYITHWMPLPKPPMAARSGECA